MIFKIRTETKIADEIAVGTKLVLPMMCGKGNFSVVSVNGDAARAMSGGTIAPLDKREDGWYDSHIRIGAEVLGKPITVRISGE